MAARPLRRQSGPGCVVMASGLWSGFQPIGLSNSGSKAGTEALAAGRGPASDDRALRRTPAAARFAILDSLRTMAALLPGSEIVGSSL